MARMTGFVFQDKYLVRLEKLSDQEVGRLVRALATYHASGETQELKGRECGYFDFIKADIDEIEASYQKKCNNMKRTQSDQPTAIATNCNQLQPIATNCDQLPINKNINKNKNKKEIDKEKSASLDCAFDKFWACYPRHTAKQDAKKAFIRIAPDDALLDAMLTSIQRWKQTSQWSDPRYIPHPASWLNGRRWEDEPPTASAVRPVKQVSAAQYSSQRDDDLDEIFTARANDLFKKGAS